MKTRGVSQFVEPRTVLEGAGVKVRRTIGIPDLRRLDPYLLLDHFGSDRPEEYQAGFPTHTHRGIQTLTYMLAGAMAHEDDSGHAGRVATGGAQLMTAGRAIRHSEMPEGDAEGRMEGVQLWFALPAELRSTSPDYQSARPEEIPELTPVDGVVVRLVAGELNGVTGPITEIAVDAQYLDVHIPAATSFAQAVPEDHTVFAYVYSGEATFGDEEETVVGPRRLAVFGEGNQIAARAHDEGVSFILVSAARAE